MKLYILSFLSGVCVLWIVNFLSDTSPVSQTAPVDLASISTIKISSQPALNSDRLIQLQQENQDLKHQLVNLRRQLNVESNKTANVNSSSIVPMHKEIAAALVVQTQLSEFRQALTSDTTQDIALKVREKFEQEAIDGVWSNDFQLKLADYFRSTNTIKTIIPQTIECRSLSCRVSVVIGDEIQSNKVERAVLDAIGSNQVGITKKIFMEQDRAHAQLNIYIARDELQSFYR